jgi:tRNA 2-selenouridine synthase
MINTLEIKDFLDTMDDNTLLIDARSPAEFKESHIKNAINLFALNNEERKEVGTLYKKSPFKAKMLGASYISKNISGYLQNELKDFTPKTRIFVYCARGGQRSGSMATILDNIGFRVYKLKGGYKSYRNYVLNYLDSFEYNNFIVLDGLTGSGKSLVIKEFENSIDLEGLANHYGSSFGAINGKQPSQKQFQNSLFHELQRVKRYNFTLLEGESKKIGKLHIPNFLYKKMLKAPRIWINSPIEERVNRILDDYKEVDETFFEDAMQKIAPYIEKKYAKQIKKAFYGGDLYNCSKILLEKYYDKVYKHRGNYHVTIDFKDIKQVVAEIKLFADNRSR